MSVHNNTFSSSRAHKELVMKGMQASLQARKRVKLDLKSPLCIYNACAACGITVRFTAINMEGMYDRVPKPRIHLSSLRPLVRRAFTCAHEFGHHFFGHGSSIDELRDEHINNDARPPNEVIADSFASFLLMPTLGMREAFARRCINPNTANAFDIYAVACNFGVGFSTLVNHLAFSQELINYSQRVSLLRFTPKRIRAEILGKEIKERLIISDQFWNSPYLDAEVGDLILLPKGVVVNAALLCPVRELATGRLFCTVKPGTTRVVLPGTSWSTQVRVSQRQFVGLAAYRHLEEESDD